MKINEINIASFGGIKNLKINPRTGLNIIYGDNENGKSTVMAFVKMMFYGNGRNSSDIAKNMRKKYTPWDGSSMAGSIDFTHSGRNYRIEREFRKSDSSDKVTLIDMDLGTREVAESDVGKKFFGLTSAGFERSVFIGQFGFPEGDPEGEIGKKLSNIALTGDETVSFEVVNNRLSKAKTNLMSKSGTAGIYDKNLKVIENLKEKYSHAVAVAENYRSEREKLSQTAKEIADLQKKADELKVKISAEQDVRNAEKLKNLLELKGELDRINTQLALSDGTIADESYLKMLQFQLGKVKTLTDSIDGIKREIEILSSAVQGGTPEEKQAQKIQAEEKIKNLTAKREEINGKLNVAQTKERDLMLKLSNPNNFKKKCNPLLLGSGTVLLLTGIVLAVIMSAKIIGIITCIVGIVALISGFIVRPQNRDLYETYRKKSDEINKQLADLKYSENDVLTELSAMKAKLETIQTALSGDSALAETNKNRLLERNQQLKTLNEELHTEKEKLHTLFARYKAEFKDEDITSSIDEISVKALKQKEIKQQINYILKDVGNISYKEAEEKLQNITASADLSADFDAIKKEYDLIMGEITEAKTAATATKVRVENMLSMADNPEELKAKISQLTKTAAQQGEYCEMLQIAMDALNESNIEVRRSFGSQLEKESAEILNRLTNGKYDSMSVSKTLDVSVEESGVFGSREIDYLSSGTADQAYLSLRLAISSLMAEEGEKLPLFMDDALAQYDDGRTRTALEFLKDYAKDGQIILFTCHKWICDISENIEIPPQKL